MSILESADDLVFDLAWERDLYAILINLGELADLTNRRISITHRTELAGPRSHKSALLIIPDPPRTRATDGLNDFCGVIHRYEKDKNICSHSGSLRKHQSVIRSDCRLEKQQGSGASPGGTGSSTWARTVKSGVIKGG